MPKSNLSSVIPPISSLVLLCLFITIGSASINLSKIIGKFISALIKSSECTSVDLPSSVELKVETTDAAIKGQTASSSYKPATLENGIKIMVPPFINSEDKIIIPFYNAKKFI